MILTFEVISGEQPKIVANYSFGGSSGLSGCTPTQALQELTDWASRQGEVGRNLVAALWAGFSPAPREKEK